MVDAQLVARAKALIDDLAKAPRFAGSEEEALARARCRAELERAGFSCRYISFEYSQWLARWASPLLALVIGILLILLSRLGLAGNSSVPGAVFFTMYGGVVLGFASIRRGWILSFPLSRAVGVNLECRRGNPKVWLVAHLDSKSQTIPMLLRIAGSVALYLAAILAGLGSLSFLIWGSAAAPALSAAQVLAAFGALTVGLCFIRNESPGAVDNVSGVTAVVLAAQSSDSSETLGVLITSGEELGLAGALAWAEKADRHLVILNCDTIDEAGTFRCMYSIWRPARILTIAEKQAKGLGIELNVGRLIPGIMADSMVFADPASWSAITLSRGTLGTLARIHTRRDNSSVLSGNGAAQASVLLSALTKELS
jgi:hypothetical protein